MDFPWICISRTQAAATIRPDTHMVEDTRAIAELSLQGVDEAARLSQGRLKTTLPKGDQARSPPEVSADLLARRSRGRTSRRKTRHGPAARDTALAIKRLVLGR